MTTAQVGFSIYTNPQKSPAVMKAMSLKRRLKKASHEIEL
jgi:hypothetical protein